MEYTVNLFAVADGRLDSDNALAERMFLDCQHYMGLAMSALQ